MRRELSLAVWNWIPLHAMLALLLLALLTSCSIPPNTPIFASTSRFHAQNVPDGSLYQPAEMLTLLGLHDHGVI